MSFINYSFNNFFINYYIIINSHRFWCEDPF